MVEISDLFELLERKPIALLFLPAVIFGYLFHLSRRSIFFYSSIIWIVIISLYIGIERSTIYPIFDTDLPMHEENHAVYDIEKNLKPIILLIYSLYVGPIAILAALNNILLEGQEIHLSPQVENFFYTSEIIQGTLVANDLILFFLFGLHISSYIIIVGPTLFALLLACLWWGYLFLRFLWWVAKIPYKYYSYKRYGRL